MKTPVFKLILLSVVLTVLSFAWMSWPLPTVMGEGIPSSHHPEEGGPRAMIAGDHLQLMYHYWLFADFLQGETDWFYNAYEFNQGNDKDRYQFGPYFLPFSFVYALGYYVGGHALGYNVAALFSLLLSAVFLLLLAWRYSKHLWIATLAAAVAMLFPYRWVTLLGGSPTGFSMMWIPMIVYAVDVAVRDRKMLWAGMAGLFIWLSGWSDVHVFFFGFLIAPAWAVFAFLYAGYEARRRWRYRVVGTLKKLIPLFLMMLFSMIQVNAVKSSMEGAVTEEGRSLSEIMLFSPHAEGFFGWDILNHSNTIYLGWILPLLAALGLLGWLIHRYRSKEDVTVPVFCFVLLLLVMTVTALLALGPNIPWKGPRLWSAFTNTVTPYALIRQTAKILCLFPVMVAVLAALSLSAWKKMDIKPVLVVLLLLVTGWSFYEYGRRFEPTICLLDDEQQAYAAVVEDARNRDMTPRALALPLWPGDSHWSSLYQYYATLYRTRMVNGYRPSVQRQYLQDIYLRLETFNKGGFSDEQLNYLTAKGVHYLLLHEDAFPEKVSPFAVAHTLVRMLEHPRLALLEHDKAVWSFHILPPGSVSETVEVDWPYKFPARRWEVERYVNTNAEVCTERIGVRGDQFARLGQPEAYTETLKYPMYYVDSLRFMARVRGHGQLIGRVLLDEVQVESARFHMADDEWVWREFPLPPFEGYVPFRLQFHASSGTVDVDSVSLHIGPWSFPEPGESMILPAADFFHAGYTELESGAVILEPDRVMADQVFYGPKMPMPAGTYSLILSFESPDAPAGTHLGDFLVRDVGDPLRDRVAVIAGREVVMEYEHPVNFPMTVAVDYNRSAVLKLNHLTIKRQDTE